MSITGILAEGMIYGIMALGVFITFRILDFPDLTVDGSFPMGAAIMGVAVVNDMNLLLAVLLAFIGGSIAGLITALIHNELKVPNLLAGILTMIMLYTVNIRILGSSNLSLINENTVFSGMYSLTGAVLGKPWSIVVLMLIVVLIIKLLIDVFFHTDLGMTLGALGNNQQMVVSQGVNPKHLKLIGVGISNGLVAVSGAFAAQYQSFADVGLGQGIIIAGLASVMIGEFLFRSNHIFILSLNVILGAVIFNAVMYAARWAISVFDFVVYIPALNIDFTIKFQATDLKFIQVLLVVGCLAATNFRKMFRTKGRTNGKA